MKKLLTLLLAVVMLVSVFTGCSLFAGNENGGKTDDNYPTEAHNDPCLNGPFNVTDAYVHEDLDVEYTHRHVLRAPENMDWVEYNDFSGENMKDCFYVIYGDDEHTVAIIEYWVSETEDDAKTYTERRAPYYASVETSGNVSKLVMDREHVEQFISELGMFMPGVVEDTCASLFAYLSASYPAYYPDN